MRLLSVLCLTCISLITFAQSPAYIRVDADDFQKQLSSPNTQLLDVRTSDEFKSGHISNALQADWNNPAQFAERTAALDKNKTVYIYCLGGGRSSAAAQWLKEKGFTSIIELEGGINSWKRSNKPLEGLVIKKGISYKEYLDTIHSNKIVLVDFGAKWCAPCKAMEPVLDSLAKDRSLQFELIRIDADANSEIIKEMDVTSIPVFIIYKNGKQVWRHTGLAKMEEIKKFLH